MNKKQKKAVSLLIASSMVLSMSSFNVFADENQASGYVDTSNHWAKNQISKWSGYEILSGFDGLFRPNDYITRGEMAVVIDRVMNYQKKSNISFRDLDKSFYTDSILRANQAGVINGSDGLVRPTDNITREEAAVLICKAFNIEPQKGMLTFSDSNQISPWAADYVSSLLSERYITGRDNNRFEPKGNITRAEAVTMLDNIVKGFYNSPGTYTESSNGTVLVNTPNTTLKNMTIMGNLIVAEGVGTGDLTLDSIDLKGDLIVKGGGINTIKITGSSKIQTAKLLKSDGDVRIAVLDNANVQKAVVSENSNNVTITGSVNTVEVNSTNNTIYTNSASITNLNMNSNANLVVANNSIVNTLTTNKQASNSSLDIKGEVRYINLNSSNNKVLTDSNSRIQQIKVNENANNSKLDIKGTATEVEINAQGITLNTSSSANITTVTTTEKAKNSILDIGSKIGTLKMNSPSSQITLNERADISNLYLNKTAENSNLTVRGKLAALSVNARQTNINVTDGTVRNINATETATYLTLNVDKNGEVNKLTTEADSTTVKGNGKVANAEIKADNASVNTVGTTLKVDYNVSGTTTNNYHVNSGTTSTTTNNGTTNSNNNSSSSNTYINNAYVNTTVPFVGSSIYGYTDRTSPNVTYQWQRTTNSNYNDWTNINTSDGTSQYYTPKTSDIGSRLRVVITGRGSYTGTRTSNATEVVVDPTNIQNYNHFDLALRSSASNIKVTSNISLPASTTIPAGKNITFNNGLTLNGNLTVGAATTGATNRTTFSVYGTLENNHVMTIGSNADFIIMPSSTLQNNTSGSITVIDGGTIRGTNATSRVENRANYTIGSTNVNNYKFAPNSIYSWNQTTSLWSTSTPQTKSVYIGTQQGILNAGTVGTVTFDIITANISDGITPTINWANGIVPAGISATVTPITGNKATVVIAGNTNTLASNTNFTVTADGATSSNATLVIAQPIAKAVTVGTQQGTLNAGTAGTVTFDIITANIADGVQPTINWANGTAPNGISVNVTPITGNKATVVIAGNTNTVAGSTNFTVTADGITSSSVTLVVSAPIPVTKTVTVGTQKGTLNAGTAGTVTFDISTENIADGVTPTITWANGTAPNGISASITPITSNKATITLTGNTNTVAGNTNFTVTADGITSSNATLVVSAPIPVTKTVTVGTQKGTLNAGTAGAVTFDISTENIADGVTPTITWANGTAPNGISASITPITSNKATVTLTGDTDTVVGSTNFTVTADGITSSNATLVVSAPIPVTKTVTVGTQKGTLNAGTVGTVTFDISTENIADGVTPTITWANGTAPNGITPNVSSIKSNKATITLTGDTDTVAGSTNFTVTADGITSSNATLVVSAPIPVTKTVTVGTQQGTLNAGTAGTVTFDISTENIADGVTPTITWANGTAPNGISASITPITSNKATITLTGNTNTVAGNTNFTVTADGITSSNATLVVSAPIPVTKTVTVGTQKGTLNAGTGGSVTFEVTTANIADGKDITVNWTNGTPKGISASATKIMSNKATVTLTGDTNTVAGNTNFTVTADGITSSSATLVVSAPIPVTKTVTVGTQKGTLNAGTGGSVTFEVTTANIADGKDITVNWTNGTPKGISASATKIMSNKATVTLTGDTNTVAGNTNFTVTADGITSSNATLVVSAPIPVTKAVTVGTQQGTLNAGTGGSVTFEVTTANIADGVTPNITWANGTAPNGISASITPITSNKAIITINGNTNIVAGSTKFTVTADGVTSLDATLLIN